MAGGAGEEEKLVIKELLYVCTRIERRRSREIISFFHIVFASSCVYFDSVCLSFTTPSARRVVLTFHSTDDHYRSDPQLEC